MDSYPLDIGVIMITGLSVKEVSMAVAAFGELG